MNELLSHPTSTAILTLIVMMTVSLFSSVFTKRWREAPRWVRVALILSCLCFWTWSFTNFYLLIWGSSLLEGIQATISHWGGDVGSIGIGISIALFLSGHLKRRPSTQKK
jgi:hypothetical protein